MNIGTSNLTQILPAIAAIIIIAVLTVYSFKHRDTPGALAFSIACMLGLLWLLGSIFEYTAPAIDAKIFWRKFQVMWQLPSATAITIFLLSYANYKRWITPRIILLLSIVPALLIFLILSDHSHHLFWRNFVYDGVLIAMPGPLMKYFIIYVYFIFVINLVVFVWLFIQSPQNRWPVVIMIFGQSIMRLMFFIEFYDQPGINIPYSPIGITFTSLMYTIVLFRFRIFGPLPFARQVLIEKIPVGIIVLDIREKVRTLNPAAARILNTSNKSARGLQIRNILGAYPQKPQEGTGDQSIEFSLEKEQKKQIYELKISPILDWRNLPIGQLLLITNVSEQRKAQLKIIDQQKVMATLKEREQLARELHDDFAQVLSFINLQSQTIKKLFQRGDVDTASEYLDRLVEVAQGVEVDVRDSILGMRVMLLKDGLFLTLEKYLAKYQREYDIQTDLIKTGFTSEIIIAPMVEIQVFRIIQEALTNVRKHAKASCVRIKFESVNGTLCIDVEDDGQGIELNKQFPASTNHFGLAMMRERAESIGGEIQLTSEFGVGTKIKICVPIQIEEVG